MIKKLQINNFKSVKKLEIECKKLNVFIGEPNSGKSNIIEALSLQNQDGIQRELSHEIFRYKTIGDLFYNFDINNPIEVITDQYHTRLEYAIGNDGVILNEFRYHLDLETQNGSIIRIYHNGEVQNPTSLKSDVRFYEYKTLQSFSSSHLGHLSVPHGSNLPELLLLHEKYKSWVSEFLNSNGLKLTLKPVENDISVSILVGDEIYSYPYFSLSETLQRIIFYTMVISANKDYVLLLDEPDSNTFPFYTKDLAEKIALDESNQFFITTHNPYLLLSLIEKSKEENLNVCITEMKDHITQASVLSNEQVTRVLDLNSDVFFNFDKILNS